MSTRVTTWPAIVHGASLAGVALACALARGSRRVLLIDTPGYPGGAVTGSLACLQRLSGTRADGWSAGLLAELSAEPRGLWRREARRVLLDPEAVKWVLQRRLEAAGVELLFHVRPVSLAAAGANSSRGTRTDPARRLASGTESGPLDLCVMGREGLMTLRAMRVIDASDDLRLAQLAAGRWPSPTETAWNFVASNLPDDARHLLAGPAAPGRLQPELIHFDKRKAWLSIIRRGQLSMGPIVSSVWAAVERLGGRMLLLPCREECRVEFHRRPQAWPRGFDPLESLTGHNFGRGQVLHRADEAAVVRLEV